MKPVRKDEGAGHRCPALHRGNNGLPGANIPYAKEIFWMSKYQLVTGRATATRRG